jgi:hypothetical protein
LTASEVRTLRAWTSLAQWVGTERGLHAIDRVEESWPGYGQVAASSILNDGERSVVAWHPFARWSALPRIPADGGKSRKP